MLNPREGRAMGYLLVQYAKPGRTALLGDVLMNVDWWARESGRDFWACLGDARVPGSQAGH